MNQRASNVSRRLMGEKLFQRRQTTVVCLEERQDFVASRRPRRWLAAVQTILVILITSPVHYITQSPQPTLSLLFLITSFCTSTVSLFYSSLCDARCVDGWHRKDFCFFVYTFIPFFRLCYVVIGQITVVYYRHIFCNESIYCLFVCVCGCGGEREKKKTTRN